MVLMSENFKLIYKILSKLESMMQFEQIDVDRISHKALNVNYELWERIIIMLFENGYIKNVKIVKYVDEPKEKVIDFSRIEITLKGLEYLEENSTMQKAKKLVKGIIDIMK